MYVCTYVCVLCHVCMYIYMYRHIPIRLAYTRYSFTCFYMCNNQSFLYYFRPFALPPLLQNTVARLLRHAYPPPDPPLICHTPHNIGNDNIL